VLPQHFDAIAAALRAEAQQQLGEFETRGRVPQFG
jgi:hypothetical protein